ncbi:MAG: apolipoprotein N-acyltransferase [Gammaproteobacteria bacterium]
MNGLTDRLGGLAVLLAGVLSVAAFAPFGWYPVVFFALAILFNQWLNDTPRQAFLHGALFGLGFFGAGVSWVYVSVQVYGHVAVLPALLVTILFVLVLALFPALLGYVLRKAFAADTWAVLVLVFPAGWTLSEWLRGWVFTGFPWLNLGTGQIDSLLAGYAPVLGVYGTGWAVALTAAALLAALRRQQVVASVLGVTLLWGGGYLFGRMEWTQPYDRGLQVRLVQGNIAQEDKWAPENMLNTLTRYLELTAAGADSDLIVWPETAIPAFYHQVEDNLIPHLQSEMQAAGATLLTGIPVLDRSAWKYYNAVVTLGAEPAFYYKRHLVAFGEYLPLRGLLGTSLDALAVPNADFSGGDARQPPLQAAGYAVGTSICFEVAFPEEIIKALPEAALLVNVSNDAWFGNSLAPHQHLEMARMRAKETGRPMLRATNTGISAIIAHDGRIQARSPQFAEAVVTGRIVPRQGATPYVRTGNWPVVIVCALLLVLVRISVRLRPGEND